MHQKQNEDVKVLTQYILIILSVNDTDTSSDCTASVREERALRCRGVVRTEGRTRGLGDRPLLVSLSVSYIPHETAWLESRPPYLTIYSFCRVLFTNAVHT
jgi:hypothetical protein